MTKKTTMVFCGVLLAMSMLVAGCGKKYSDVERATNQVVVLMEGFTADMEKVNSPEAAANAINKFADAMEMLKPKLDAFEKKYPELEDGSNVPAELKEVQGKVEAAAEKMVDGMVKIMPYAQDPKVMEAIQRLQGLSN